jgi:hypothetical protein
MGSLRGPRAVIIYIIQPNNLSNLVFNKEYKVVESFFQELLTVVSEVQQLSRNGVFEIYVSLRDLLLYVHSPDFCFVP